MVIFSVFMHGRFTVNFYKNLIWNGFRSLLEAKAVNFEIQLFLLALLHLRPTCAGGAACAGPVLTILSRVRTAGDGVG